MTLIYLLYDSINNTIFASQVWGLFLNFLAQKKYQQIILISFENQNITHNYHHPAIEIIILKRTKYLGKISLLINLLKLIFYVPKTNYHLVARGPFAGYLAIKINQIMLHNLPRTSLIQARGLASAEYAYTHRNFIKFRAWQLLKLEHYVYSQNIKIECVSLALQKYLITKFNAYPQNLTLAQDDLPNKIKPAQLATWRHNLRKQFNIAPNKLVYCYSGSNHPWQCPELTIKFFKNQLAQNQDAYLLVLTNQVNFFTSLIQQQNILPTNYLVLSVTHDQIYQYLAMADYGLLFREKHIINWVSRPTKALEYASANLPIMHNHTICWLANKKNPARILN